MGFALTIAALVLAGTFAASQIGPVYFAARTPIFVLPAVALAAGVAVAELAPMLVTTAVALMVVVSAVRYTVRSSRQPDPFPTRASLAQVAGRARCGDTIVATGLSYAPLTYYAADAGVPACVAMTPFPESVRDHPGWLDLSEAAKTEMAARASSEVERLASSGTLWVFVARTGVGQAEGEACVRELSSRRPSRESTPLPGSFFDELRVFGPSDRRTPPP